MECTARSKKKVHVPYRATFRLLFVTLINHNRENNGMEYYNFPLYAHAWRHHNMTKLEIGAN